MATFDVDYTASATGKLFHNDDNFVRAIMGPVGSSKTVTCCLEILILAMKQTPDKNGVRRTRSCVVRQSYPQLITTAVKTFEEWVGPLGKMTYGTPIQFRAKFPLADGTTVSMEVLFLALERPEDAVKLRSLELSSAMFSEYAELPEDLLKMMRGRVGRFPPPKDGVECLQPCIIMESNPPSMRSHWYRLFEQDRPKGHKLFKQPPAMFFDPQTEQYSPNPAAENIQNLPGGYDYYRRQIEGASRDYISVYVMAEYGSTYSGQVIYDEYKDSEHAAPEILRPVTKSTLVLGMDMGLNAAVAVCEQTQTGALQALDEVCGNDIMLDVFLDDHLRPMLFHSYQGWPIQFVIDPSGNEGKAGYVLLTDRKWAAAPAPTNDPGLRWAAVKWFLSRRNGFVMSPSCAVMREGFLGGYSYKKTAVSVNAPHLGRADKNHTSHIHDALQYAALYFRHQSERSRRPVPTVVARPTLWA